jgi:ATP-binding cassette, subfamily C, bacterial CydD
VARSVTLPRVLTRLRGSLQSIAALSTRETVRGIQAVAGLTLLERLLTPLAAWFVIEGNASQKLGVALALAAAFSLRGFAQRFFVARAMARMFERMITALVGGDVLRTSVLPGRDARSELAQAVFQAASGVAQDAPGLLADGVASVLMLALILALEPLRLVLLAAGLTAVAAVGVVWSRGRLHRAAERAWAAQEAVLLTFVDALEGRLEVVAAGRGAAFLDGARGRTRAWARASTRVAWSALVSGRLPMLAVAVLVVVLVSASSRSLGELGITLPDLALFASVTPPFAGVAQGLHALVRSEHWMGLVAQVVRLPGRAPGGSRPAPASPATVVFERVSFEYAGAETRTALSRVDFEWGRGRILALAGTNGSGKSTCLRLMLGLAEPSAGVVLVGGVPLASLDIEAWRRGVAFLPQRAYMPPQANVGAAIRFLAPEATDDEISGALDRVGLLESLRRSADDPLTIAVETLSVGERQRVAIARLLCRQAAVYLLDEPDANLDRAGIAMCARLVRELADRAMVAFAAHTPELIEVADDVVTLDRGRLVPGTSAR